MLILRSPRLRIEVQPEPVLGIVGQRLGDLQISRAAAVMT
jgi:hypothetical protein